MKRIVRNINLISIGLLLVVLVGCASKSSSESSDSVISQKDYNEYRNTLSVLEGLRYPGFADRPDEYTIPTGRSPRMIVDFRYEDFQPSYLSRFSSDLITGESNGIELKLTDYEYASVADDTWEELSRNESDGYYYIFYEKTDLSDNQYVYLFEYYADSDYHEYLGSYYSYFARVEDDQEYYNVFFDQNKRVYYEKNRKYTKLIDSDYDNLYEECIETDYYNAAVIQYMNVEIYDNHSFYLTEVFDKDVTASYELKKNNEIVAIFLESGTISYTKEGPYVENYAKAMNVDLSIIYNGETTIFYGYYELDEDYIDGYFDIDLFSNPEKTGFPIAKVTIYEIDDRGLLSYQVKMYDSNGVLEENPIY